MHRTYFQRYFTSCRHPFLNHIEVIPSFSSLSSSVRIVPEGGHCFVHRFIGSGDEAIKLKEKYPGSEVWVHPECLPELQDRADYVLSTGGMVKRASVTDAKVIIVGTEEGLIDRLRRENPEKQFLPAKKYMVCGAQKRITLENLYSALVYEEPVVIVPADVSVRARIAIERMLEMS
jgi:quinolinate synthase